MIWFTRDPDLISIIRSYAFTIIKDDKEYDWGMILERDQIWEQYDSRIQWKYPITEDPELTDPEYDLIEYKVLKKIKI